MARNTGGLGVDNVGSQCLGEGGNGGEGEEVGLFVCHCDGGVNLRKEK